MSRCEDFRDSLSASLDGALPPGEAAALQAHLAQCPACRQALADLRATVAEVRGLEPVEPPPGFAEAILARTAPPRRRILPFHSHPQVRAAALVLICLTGLLVVKVAGPRRGVPAPPTPLPQAEAPAAPPTAATPAPPPRRPAPASRPAAPVEAAPTSVPETPAARDEAPRVLAAPAQMMRKAAGGALREDLKEEAFSLAAKGAGIFLHLDLRTPGDPAAAITAALEQCGATGIRLQGRSAMARMESWRLPALLAALEKTGRVRELPPRDLPPGIHLTLSW